MAEGPGFRRAMLLMTGSSLLVPLVGLATAPILAQALGVAGRGEVAAAIAPNLLLVVVATLGLPEAMTYHLARRPSATRRVLLWSSLLTSAVGAVGLVVVFLAADFLSAGDAELSDLILLATVLAIPSLGVNLLRGAATGRQMWSAVALERAISSLLRFGALACLAVFGQLDVLSAVLVSTIAPIIAACVYWRLLLPARQTEDEDLTRGGFKQIMTFGSQVWLGSITAMLLGRLSQLLVTPLSDINQLGLLVVAITISDVPFIVATAVRDTIFGVDSKDNDAIRLSATSRMATLVGFAGSAVIGVTVPFWIVPLFGDGFDGATLPTVLLLIAAVIGIPGLIAGAGLGAWGRPGLRTIGSVLTLVVNLVAMLVLVPQAGAIGAAWAAVISTTVSTAFFIGSASRIVDVRWWTFIAVTPGDVVTLAWEVLRLLGRGRSGNGRHSSP